MPSSPSSSRRLWIPIFVAGLIGAGQLAGCTPQLGGSTEDSNAAELNRVPDSVLVNGKSYNVESEYLPRVVMCENPQAPTESLRAQAIAARTFLTYKFVVERKTSVRDGQSDQVFTCPANMNGKYVSDEVRQAVVDTAGQIVLHGDTVTAGFFVAGALRNSACAATSDPTGTEQFVTVNVNRSGAKVRPSTLGNSGSPSNRGAMGQLLANCLAKRNGYDAGQILTYFYGADITIRGEGPIAAVPTPAENDPAAQTVTLPTTEPTLMDPMPTPAAPKCFSFTLQDRVAVGECVQSAADQAWWQCTSTGEFSAVEEGSGSAGPCTVEYAL